MTKSLRIKKFLNDVDNIIQENTYYDEEKETDICTITENDVYNKIISTDEYRLLTSEFIKNIIHIFMTDFTAQIKMLKAYNLL